MAQSNVNMSKLKRSFQMLAAKIPQRTICEQLHMGRGVLNRYKTLADSQGLSYGVIGRMSDSLRKKNRHATFRGCVPIPFIICYL